MTPTQQLPPEQSHSDGEELSLLDLLLVLARHKKKIIFIPLLAGVIAAAYAMQIPPTYTATIKLSVPSQSQPSAAAALLGQLGPLAGGLGTSGAKNNTELFLTILKGRTVSDKIIKEFDLIQHYKLEGNPKKQNSASKLLATRVNGKVGRLDGVITWSVIDTDPQMAAKMAAAFTKELEAIIQGLAVTEASQRRIFLEKQLRKCRDDLSAAEVLFRQMQETTGIIKLDEQGTAIIKAIATLQTQIIEKEVELGTLRLAATDKNPEVARIQQAIAGMRTQLGKLENSNTNNPSVMLATSKVPQAGLDYLRAMRELKYQETIYEIIARQYEVARADEAKDAPVIQVIETPIPPEERTAPKRTQIVMMATIAAAFFSVVLAYVLEAKKRVAADPNSQDQLRELSKHFKLAR